MRPGSGRKAQLNVKALVHKGTALMRPRNAMYAGGPSVVVPKGNF